MFHTYLRNTLQTPNYEYLILLKRRHLPYTLQKHHITEKANLINSYKITLTAHHSPLWCGACSKKGNGQPPTVADD